MPLLALTLKVPRGGAGCTPVQLRQVPALMLGTFSLYFLEPSQQGWAPGQFVILQTGKQRSQVTREAHTGSEEQARIFIFKFYLFIFTCLKGREGQKDRDLPFTGSLLGQEPGTHSRPTTWVARTLVLEPYLLPPSNWNQEWSWDTNLCPLRWVAGIPSGVLTAIPKAPS